MLRVVLALFVVALGIDIGAGFYETRIIVPIWSSGLPETLAAGNPFGRVQIAAGMRFWAFVTPLVAVLAIVLLILAWRASSPRGTWAVAAAIVELCVVAGTLLYFKPTLVRLFMTHGAGLSTPAITSSVHRWIHWNYGRAAVSFLAWCLAIVALALA